MKKKVFYTIVIALILIQFYRPAKNISESPSSNSITAMHETSAEVNVILEKACNDCHSNNTVYPWYANIQPVAYWMNDHIEEAKRELNFDEFGTYNLRRQFHKLEEVVEQVRDEKEMPLNSYTWIHKEAKLNDIEINTLCNWAIGIQEDMKSKYPMDSLVKPK